MSGVPLCICVPARNEAARLPILLDALANQTISGSIPVAVCINNSDDDSVAAVLNATSRHADRLDIRIEERVFAVDLAHAGSARGCAMAMGYNAMAGSGILISTDADCRPPADWIAANLDAFTNAEIVGGRIMLDDAEPIPPIVATMRERFDRYWSSVRAIEDAIDPSPHDPPPRHGDHTGASLAIDAALFDKVRGVPAIPSGEDRALVVSAISAGGRLIHPPSVWTRVSARTDGRAAGGMAEAMADLQRDIDQAIDPQVPAFDHWATRARWRRTTRIELGVAAMLVREEHLPPMPLDMPLPQ